jgi:thiamine transporter
LECREFYDLRHFLRSFAKQKKKAVYGTAKILYPKEVLVMENRNKNLVVMVECALFVAVALALDLIKLPSLPNGGSIKLVMLPLIIVALRRGVKWGTVASMVYLVIAIVLGREEIFYPGSTVTVIVVCILLDYVLAYAVCGLAPIFAKLFPNKVLGNSVATLIVCLIRYFAHFLSGATIWADMTQGFKGVVWFSLAYNGTYMIPITIVCVVVIAILSAVAPRIFRVQTTA